MSLKCCFNRQGQALLQGRRGGVDSSDLSFLLILLTPEAMLKNRAATVTCRPTHFAMNTSNKMEMQQQTLCQAPFSPHVHRILPQGLLFHKWH